MTAPLTRRSLLFRSAAVLAGVQVADVARLFGADAKSKLGVQMYMVLADFEAANAARVKLMHFKDFSKVRPPITEVGPEAEGHIVDLGTRVAPLKAAYEAARKAGAEYFIVDHDPPFPGKTPLETAKVDYAYAAGLMGV
jgi:hypothetical protein